LAQNAAAGQRHRTLSRRPELHLFCAMPLVSSRQMLYQPRLLRAKKSGVPRGPALPAAAHRLARLPSTACTASPRDGVPLTQSRGKVRARRPNSDPFHFPVAKYAPAPEAVRPVVPAACRSSTSTSQSRRKGHSRPRTRSQSRHRSREGAFCCPALNVSSPEFGKITSPKMGEICSANDQHLRMLATSLSGFVLANMRHVRQTRGLIALK
jgi:hypothetical protein